MTQSVLQSTMLQTVSLWLGFTGLMIAVLADHLQTLAKYVRIKEREIAGGYNLAMKVMVLNRVGAVMFFMLVALNIDRGLSSRVLSHGLSITLLFCLVPTIWAIFWLSSFFAKHSLKLHVLDYSSWPIDIFLATFFATALNLYGLTIPWIAGAMYPDLRLTLTNSSFLFNTTFTVVNVFFIEHRFAKIVDAESEKLDAFVTCVTFARLFSFMFVAATLLAFSPS